MCTDGTVTMYSRCGAFSFTLLSIPTFIKASSCLAVYAILVVAVQ